MLWIIINKNVKCLVFLFSENHQCLNGYRKCVSGQCIPSEWWCDYINDCPDKSDEFECHQSDNSCSEQEFRCSNGQCISKEYQCFVSSNPRKGCADKSNLKNCKNWNCTKQNNQLKCGDSYCVDNSLRCNGKIDCPDWADEAGCRKYLT